MAGRRFGFRVSGFGLGAKGLGFWIGASFLKGAFDPPKP